MRRVGTLGVVVMTAVVCAGQALGDLAREQRTSRKGAASQHVYTNDDFPARNVPTEVEQPMSGVGERAMAQASVASKSGEKVLAKIRVEKANIATVETRIREIEKRLRERPPVGTDLIVGQQVLITDIRGGAYPGICNVGTDGDWNPYSAWCQEGFRLAAELEQRRMDLEKSRILLEGFQEEARRMGYRSAVYDAE